MIELLTAATKSLAWRLLRMCGLVLCCQAKFAISSMKSWVAYVIRGMASAETILGRESHESCFMIRLIRASGSSSQRRTLFLVNVNNFSAKKFVILSFIYEHEGHGKERQTRAGKGETKSMTPPQEELWPPGMQRRTSSTLSLLPPCPQVVRTFEELSLEHALKESPRAAITRSLRLVR